MLGAERIGHGTSSAQDPALLEYLAEHQIALEVCPTSNIATRAVASLDEHPLPDLVKAGVLDPTKVVRLAAIENASWRKSFARQASTAF